MASLMVTSLMVASLMVASRTVASRTGFNSGSKSGFQSYCGGRGGAAPRAADP